MSADDDDRPTELRERIVDAALHVIREHGMARARTSAIAEAAGCAEGSIYRYFSDKPELLTEVVRTRLPDLQSSLRELPLGAGRATLRSNLVDASRVTAAFYAEVVPLAAGILADAELLRERRPVLDPVGLAAGAADAVAAYLRAEQELGRVRPGADAEAAARLLIASCLGESVLEALAGRHHPTAACDGVIAEAVEALVAGLDPVGEPPARRSAA